ncbi:MAG: hypothetical protein E7560_04550 [Ruminococcaceae bacterium]|nr:hypothetical protein [Oscillospiraceae bacterium]
MPDYKKKKHSKLFRPKPKKIKKSAQKFDIEMEAQKPRPKRQKPSSMKVVKGKKEEHLRRWKITAIGVALALVLVVVLNLIFPAGLFQSVSNAVSIIGTGSFPIETDGTQTINTVSKGNYFYVLTNSHISAISNSGKKIFSFAHGFDNPVIKTSSDFSLVYEQGGKQVLIFDLKGLKRSAEAKKAILTAAISDSGAYAIATRSEKYNSAVTVYSKKGKMLYEWYSAEDTVNNVVISPRANKIAVSTFNASSGQFASSVKVLSFKSPTPLFTYNISGSLVYNLDNSSRSGFTIIESNTLKFVKWSNYKTLEYTNEYNTSMLRTSKNGKIAVFNRESDKTDNKIAVFAKNGKCKYELQYKGIISDIALLGRHIYCISDTDVFVLDTNGEVINRMQYGFGATRISVTGNNTVAIITDNKIEKQKLE